MSPKYHYHKIVVNCVKQHDPHLIIFNGDYRNSSLNITWGVSSYFLIVHSEALNNYIFVLMVTHIDSK